MSQSDDSLVLEVDEATWKKSADNREKNVPDHHDREPLMPSTNNVPRPTVRERRAQRVQERKRKREDDRAAKAKTKASAKAKAKAKAGVKAKVRNDRRERATQADLENDPKKTENAEAIANEETSEGQGKRRLTPLKRKGEGKGRRTRATGADLENDNKKSEAIADEDIVERKKKRRHLPLKARHAGDWADLMSEIAETNAETGAEKAGAAVEQMDHGVAQGLWDALNDPNKQTREFEAKNPGTSNTVAAGKPVLIDLTSSPSLRRSARNIKAQDAAPTQLKAETSKGPDFISLTGIVPTGQPSALKKPYNTDNHSLDDGRIYLTDTTRVYQPDLVLPPPIINETDCRWLMICNVPVTATVAYIKRLFTKAIPINVTFVRDSQVAYVGFESITETVIAEVLFKRIEVGDDRLKISLPSSLDNDHVVFDLPRGRLETMPWDQIRSETMVMFRTIHDLPLGARCHLTSGRHVRRMVQNPEMMRKVPPPENPLHVIPYLRRMIRKCVLLKTTEVEGLRFADMLRNMREELLGMEEGMRKYLDILEELYHRPSETYPRYTLRPDAKHDFPPIKEKGR